MNPTRITTALFKNQISDEEIPFFRGAMIRLSGDDALFHNHNVDGFNYMYPLVQYKRIKGAAAVIGINQGSELLSCLFEKGDNFFVQIGNQEKEMEIVMCYSDNVTVTCEVSTEYTYSISRWLPLNSENYRMYQLNESLVERISMLEKILVANILSFAKGVGIYFEHLVMCHFLQLESTGLIRYKDVELMSFSGKFRCNVRLPEGVGLGKLASMNCGVIKYVNK